MELKGIDLMDPTIEKSKQGPPQTDLLGEPKQAPKACFDTTKPPAPQTIIPGYTWQFSGVYGVYFPKIIY